MICFRYFQLVSWKERALVWHIILQDFVFVSSKTEVELARMRVISALEYSAVISHTISFSDCCSRGWSSSSDFRLRLPSRRNSSCQHRGNNGEKPVREPCVSDTYPVGGCSTQK